MKKRLLAGLATGILMVGIAGVASATLVTSLPGGTIVSMPALDDPHVGPSTQTVAPGTSWSSDAADPVFGYDTSMYATYDFGANGSWDGIGIMASPNSSFEQMTFIFSSPGIRGVGGFINYDPLYGPATISVYDSNNNLLESADLNFLTDGSPNTGSFYGFTEDTDIGYFTLANAYIGITDLTTVVPEPATLLLFGTGIAGLAAAGRRKSKKEYA